jgi:hypothetical protein
MLLTAHKDLKAAITALPVKEKDKLLLRLIGKDKVLTEHLHFKLLEDESDLEHRSTILHEDIDNSIANLKSGSKTNSKDVLSVMRGLNGKINLHQKVTKDLNSEMELRLHLLMELPVIIKAAAYGTLYVHNEKLQTYFVKTTLSVYKKYLKMHEDLQFDLSGSLNEVLTKVYGSSMAHAGKLLGLPEEI